MRSKGEIECRCPLRLPDTLELPVVGSPLFIVSGPELVIAQCKAGIVGSFPALNARPVEKLDEWLTRIENELGEYKALNPEQEGRALRGQPDLPRLQRPADEGHGNLREAQGSDHHHLAASAAGDRRGRAFLWRRGVPRRDQRQACAQGRRTGRRRPHSGLRRRRRTCRHAVAVRAGARGQAVVQGHRSCCRARSPTAGALPPRSRSAPTSPTWARASSRPRKPMPIRPTRRRWSSTPRTTSSIPTCSPACTATISGPSIAAAGLDPANLPVADKSKMNFGSGGNMKSKAWRDIWGSRPGHRPDRRRAAGRRTGASG